MSKGKRRLYEYQSVTHEQWVVDLLIQPNDRHFVVIAEKGGGAHSPIPVPAFDGSLCLDHPALSWESYCLSMEYLSSKEVVEAILDRQITRLLKGEQAVACLLLDADSLKWDTQSFIEAQVKNYPDELEFRVSEVKPDLYLMAKKPLYDFFEVKDLRFIFDVVNQRLNTTKIAPFQLEDDADWASLYFATIPELMTLLNPAKPTHNPRDSNWGNRCHRAFWRSLLSGMPLVLAIDYAYSSYLTEWR